MGIRFKKAVLIYCKIYALHFFLRRVKLYLSEFAIGIIPYIKEKSTVGTLESCKGMQVENCCRHC